MVDQVLGVELERKIVWVEAQIWVAWGEICASRAPNDFSRPSEMCLSSSNGTAVEPQKPLYMLIEKFINGPAIVNV